MDIAQLGIRIDSDDAKSGAKDLDDLSSAAHRAEAATEALRKTSDGAARGQKAASVERQKAIALAKQHAQAIQQSAAASARDAVTLQQMEAAAEQARMAKQQLRDISESLTAAERREAGMREILEAATQQSTAATRAYTGALHAQNAASRQAAMRMQQMVYQSNDIIVSLMSGQAAHTVAMQQGSQLAQVYGGQGGVAQAFKDVASMAKAIAVSIGRMIVAFWPYIAAVTALTAAFFALRARAKDFREVMDGMENSVTSNQKALEETAEYVNRINLYRIATQATEATTRVDTLSNSIRGMARALNDVSVASYLKQLADIQARISETEAGIEEATKARNRLLAMQAEREARTGSRMFGNMNAREIGEINSGLSTMRIQLSALRKNRDEMGGLFGEKEVAALKAAFEKGGLQGAIEAYRKLIVAATSFDPEQHAADAKRAAEEIARIEQEAARAREEAFSRIKSISDAAYQARLRNEGNVVDLINYRRDQELQALSDAADKALANGAAYEDVYKATAQAYVNIFRNAEDEVQAYRDEKRAEEVRKAEEHARRLARVETDARRFDLDMQIGAANDNSRSVGIWQGSGITDFDPSIAQEQIRLEEQAKLQALSEMEAERLALIRNNEEERLRIQKEFAARRDAVEEESLRRQSELQMQVAAVAMQNAEAIFSSLTDAARTAFGEQSGVFKAALIAEKTVAIARALMGIQAGMAQALALPFPANLAAYAQVAAMGASILANLKSVSVAVAGKREYGGPVNAGMLYEVNERNKPEMFESGGRRYVMPGQNGKVTPFERMPANDNGSRDSGPGKITLEVPEGWGIQLDEQARKLVQVERIAQAAPGQAVSAITRDLEKGGGPASSAIERNFAPRRGVG